MKPNNSVCSLLWKHVCIRESYKVSPCCRYSEKLSPEVQVESDGAIDLNSEALKSIRMKMINNEPLDGCKKCYDDERLYNWSLRKHYNKTAKPNDFDSLETSIDKVEYLEVFVGSVCNLRCVSCSPYLSNAIYKDYSKLGWPISPVEKLLPENRYSFINEMKSLAEVKFVGGEPLLNPLHDKIIDSLEVVGCEKLQLTYFTNATIFPKEKVLSVWGKSKKINLNLSLDGVSERNDYLRMNSKWSKIEDIVHRYFRWAEKFPQVTIQVNVTVSILNLLYIQEVEDWFETIRASYPNVKVLDVYLSQVTDPEYLDIRNAPRLLRKKAVEKLSGNISIQHKRILELIQESLVSDKEFDNQIFLKFIESLEGLRGNSFRKTFPELSEFF